MDIVKFFVLFHQGEKMKPMKFKVVPSAAGSLSEFTKGHLRIRHFK